MRRRSSTPKKKRHSRERRQGARCRPQCSSHRTSLRGFAQNALTVTDRTDHACFSPRSPNITRLSFLSSPHGPLPNATMTVPLNSSYYSPPDIVINGKQQPQPQVFEQHTDQPGPSSSTPAPAHPQLGYNEPPTNTSPIPTPTTTSTSTTQPQPQAHSITIQARDGQLPQIYVMSKPEPAPVAAPPAVAAPLPLPPPPPPPPAAHRRPHPLLWVTLAISVLALVLGVPKGSIPTFTGRHRALRVSRWGWPRAWFMAFSGQCSCCEGKGRE